MSAASESELILQKINENSAEMLRQYLELEDKYFRLVAERDELLASLPSISGKTRNEARDRLGEVYRHSTNPPERYPEIGVVAVNNALSVVENLIAHKESALLQRDQHASEIWRLRMELGRASHVAPHERGAIECHIRMLLSDEQAEEIGLPGRPLHIQVMRILSAYQTLLSDTKEGK